MIFSRFQHLDQKNEIHRMGKSLEQKLLETVQVTVIYFFFYEI